MWLCHRAATLASIHVSFGLRAVPDVPCHGAQLWAGWAAWRQQTWCAGWLGAILLHGMSPGTLTPGERSHPIGM